MTKTSFAVAILLALTMPANAAERASVLEGDIARLLEGSVEYHPRPGLPDEARQYALAVLERRAAEITSVELEEIEGA